MLETTEQTLGNLTSPRDQVELQIKQIGRVAKSKSVKKLNEINFNKSIFLELTKSELSRPCQYLQILWQRRGEELAKCGTSIGWDGCPPCNFIDLSEISQLNKLVSPQLWMRCK